VRSIRSVLTLWYTVAFAAAVLAFGATITALQRRASLAAQDERLMRLTGRVDSVLVERAHDGRGPVLDLTFAPREVHLRQDVEDQLGLTPGLVLVVDTSGKGVFGSPEVRRLTPTANDTLRRRLRNLAGGEERFALALDHTAYRFVAQRVAPGMGLVAVAVGEPAPDVQGTLTRFGESMIVVMPIILALVGALGWLLADRALLPVRGMIDELEAITDGRSLHRRLLAGGPQPDELGRLANALNALLARLETSFGALRRFVADASHELKTPLMVMRAGVERAMGDAGTAPSALVPLEETLQEIRRTTELVETLLTLARVDEGRMELHRERVDVAGVVSEVYETAQILGEVAGVDVQVTVPEVPVVVDADRGRLRQLVMNIAENAVKYTPAGGSVWLGLSAAGGTATFVVRDTGIGIAPGDVARVFDRFWRADQARSRTGDRPGIGLGLSICKWIAEAHGGSIGVTSRPGRGSTFTVTLPLAHFPGPLGPAGQAPTVMES